MTENNSLYVRLFLLLFAVAFFIYGVIKVVNKHLVQEEEIVMVEAKAQTLLNRMSVLEKEMARQAETDLRILTFLKNAHNNKDTTYGGGIGRPNQDGEHHGAHVNDGPGHQVCPCNCR